MKGSKLKIIIEREDFEFSIKEATLLSIEEYKKYKPIIPLLGKWWWLRSPGFYHNYTAIVNFDGSVDEYGRIVSYGLRAVRPALKIQISNLESFKPGNKLDLLDKRWTVLDVFENSLYILCDESIDYHEFDAEDNVWGTSELRAWLEEKFEVKEYE